MIINENNNNIIYLNRIDSTNVYVKNKFHKIKHNTMVIAKEQFNGKGRFDRNWISQIGGLYATYLIKKKMIVNESKYYSMIACLSTLEVIRQNTLSNIYIKWPNDIYYSNKKISGILCESIFDEENINYLKGIIIGIGININNTQNKFNNRISIMEINNKQLNINQIINDLYLKIFNYCNELNQNVDYIINSWKNENNKLLNKIIKFTDPNTNQKINAKILKIENDGSLLILNLNSNITQKLYTGDFL